MGLQARAQEAGLRAGWWLGPRIPRRAVGPLTDVAARAALATSFVRPDGWNANAARVFGHPPTPQQSVRALARYTRYALEMLSLPGWSAADVAAAVRIRTDDFTALRDDLRGPGAVLALGHLGNWDLAGAWACRHGLPVSSVAEELPGAAYRDFLRYRAGLGFQIYGHRDPAVVGKLVADARAHRLVCLLADRDLKRRGLPVRWPLRTGTAHVTVPAGPMLVAQRSGAVLRALALRYDGGQMVMDFSAPIDVGSGRPGLLAAAQKVADHLGGAVVADPTQWHVLQPFFVESG